MFVCDSFEIAWTLSVIVLVRCELNEMAFG